MSQYLVTYQDTEQEYTPPYDYHDKGVGSYSRVTVQKYAIVDSIDKLLNYKTYSNVKYFEIAREINPVFEVKVTVKV
jgi:hypothetical protein